MTLETGARLGPYEVLEPIGAGGMCEVYRARDSRLGAHRRGQDPPRRCRRRPRSDRAFRSLVVSLACFLWACGGSGGVPANDASSAAATPATRATSTDIDPCALVTSVEATQALGAAVGPAERPKEANHPPRMVTCRYVAPKGQGVAVMTVLVQRSDTESQARQGFQSAKELFPDATAVPGLGDDAFAVANQLNVLNGAVYLNITGDFDLAASKTLAANALQRLR